MLAVQSKIILLTNQLILNTVSPKLNTGGIGLNIVGSSVNTTTPEDMVGPSYTVEVTHDESLHNEDDTEVDVGNILKSY
ncbi:hypothetical protein Tco_1095911, partial [Tanacetum coccineum]